MMIAAIIVISFIMISNSQMKQREKSSEWFYRDGRIWFTSIFHLNLERIILCEGEEKEWDKECKSWISKLHTTD